MASTGSELVTQPAAPAAPTPPKPLMRVFFMLYTILAAIILIIFVIVVIISIVDVIRFILREANQKKRFLTNQEMMNKDSTDIELITAYLSNDPDKETYNIFSNQLLMNTIMTMGGIVLLIFVIQLLIFLIIKFLLRNSVLGIVENLQPQKADIVSIAVIGTVLFAVIALNSLYTKKFLGRAQPELRDMRATLIRIKNLLYGRMTTDATFLAYLRQGNLADIKNYLISKLKSRADEDVQRMIFTMNLYVLFYTRVPQTDKNYNTIMGIFQRDNIIKRGVDITQYFGYNRSVYIPNYYPSLRDDLSPFLDKRERSFVTSLSETMGTANRELSNLMQIPIPKRSVYSYMVIYALVAALFVIVLAVILIFGGVGEAILNLIAKIRAVGK